MLDIYSKYYLKPAEQLFLRRTTRWLRRIINANRDLGATKIAEANALLDVLDGWMPLGIGSGCICVEIPSFGDFIVRVSDTRHGNEVFRFFIAPVLPLGIQGSFLGVFEADTKGTSLGSADRQDFVYRLLRRADRLGGALSQGSGHLGASWESWECPEPSQEWIRLREKALKGGGQPPRAIHWLPDSKSPTNPNPSTAIKQVQHG